MNEDDITYKVRDCIYKVYSKLGHGLLDSVYEEALSYEFNKRGLYFERQKILSIIYDDIVLNHAFRLDLLVENKVVVEIKSVKELQDVHYKQLTTYLKLANKYVGLLVNFNEADIVKATHRVYNARLRPK